MASRSRQTNRLPFSSSPSLPYSLSDFLPASQESPTQRLSQTDVFVLHRGAVGKEQSC